MIKLIIEWMNRQKRRLKEKCRRKWRKLVPERADVIIFAYGSIMSSMRLADRIGSFRRLGTYKLKDYKLVFNAGRKIAFANVEKCEGSYVDGVLYRMTYKNAKTLNGYEALYRREVIRDEAYELPIEFYVSNIITDANSTLEYLHHIKIGIMENDLPFNRAYRDAKMKILNEYKGERHYEETEHI